jgi:ComEC/Rec2-related protein
MALQLRKTRLVPFFALALPWLPCALAFCGVWALGLAGRLSHGLEMVLASGLLAAAWLGGRRLWPLSLITLAVLAPLAWQAAILQPRAGGELGRLPPGTYLRIRGTVRGQAPRTPARGQELRLLLGEAAVWGGGLRRSVPELEAVFPSPGRRHRPLPYGRDIRIGGALRAADRGGLRPRVELGDAEYHLAARPISPWSGETLRMRLRHRAGYYLGEAALAVYLPIVLGVRERRSPEAWEVVKSFRRVGISHLFAISGLHIGLLLLILLAVAHVAGGWFLRGQGWLHSRAAARVGAVCLVWAYIALIGFPVPAVRAALMGSMLVWSGLWGTRTPPLYLLWLAGLILVAVTPTIVYNLSFQLSFLAFFFLLVGLHFHAGLRGEREAAGRRRWLSRTLLLAGMNLMVTLAITVGIWPVVAIHFGQISLLVFLGNLLMIPLLSTVVLPGGIVALLVSLAHLGSLPGGWTERIVFGALEGVLEAWLWLIRLIDRAGSGLVLPVRLTWGPREVFLYYALLGAGIFLLWQIGRGEGRKFIFVWRVFRNPLKIR